MSKLTIKSKLIYFPAPLTLKILGAFLSLLFCISTTIQAEPLSELEESQESETLFHNLAQNNKQEIKGTLITAIYTIVMTDSEAVFAPSWIHA